MPSIETLKEWWEFAVPILPYLATILLTFFFMRDIVKPILREKRNPKTKQFTSKGWWYVRRFMVFYPAVFGTLLGVVFKAAGVTDGSWFYFMMCGLSAQLVVHFIRDLAKAKGYNVASLSDTISISSPPKR